MSSRRGKKLICPNTGVSKGYYRGRKSDRNMDDADDILQNKLINDLAMGRKIKAKDIPRSWQMPKHF